MKKLVAASVFVLAAVGAALLLSSCTQATPVDTGTPVKGFAKGVISAKGTNQVNVNGVVFNTATANITVDGALSADTALVPGMEVEIQGDINDTTFIGTATAVAYQNTLEGPIDTIGTNTMVVLGQTINIDAKTRFISPLTAFSDLALGNIVEIAGITDNKGEILATMIEAQPTLTTYEIDGVVSALNTTTSSFTLTPQNGGTALTVNFSGSLSVTILNASLVEIKIPAAGWSYVAKTATIPASSVELKNELQPVEGDFTEVEGIVSGLSGTTFTVNGISVNSGTLSLAGVTNGVRVEATGTFSAGVLTAIRIVIK